MYCNKPGTTQCYSTIPAEGTPCGRGKVKPNFDSGQSVFDICTTNIVLLYLAVRLKIIGLGNGTLRNETELYRKKNIMIHNYYFAY